MLPADRPKRAPAEAMDVELAAAERKGDAACHQLERWLKGRGNRFDQAGLATARFAREAVDLAGRNGEADVVDGTHLTPHAERRGAVVGAEARDGEDRRAQLLLRPRRLRGSMCSFIDTASRNSPMKVITTASTGKNIHHQMPATSAVCWLAQ